MIDTKHNYIGIEYMDMQYNVYTVESYSDKYNAYMVKPEGMNIHNIVPESELEFFLNKQDLIIQCKNKTEQAAKAEQDRKDQEQERYNNVYGFCDNMKPMQKGKVLKTLNKLVNFRFNNYGAMYCKDFILKALKDGLKPVVQYDVHYYSSRAEKGYTVKPVVCTMNLEDGTSVDITKTEYDYALYLAEKFGL